MWSLSQRWEMLLFTSRAMETSSLKSVSGWTSQIQPRILNSGDCEKKHPGIAYPYECGLM